MHYPHKAGIVNTSKTLLNKYPNYLILISPIGHQKVGKQMKLVLVIVQIKTKEKFIFKFLFQFSQNVP